MRLILEVLGGCALLLFIVPAVVALILLAAGIVKTWISGPRKEKR